MSFEKPKSQKIVDVKIAEVHVRGGKLSYKVGINQYIFNTFFLTYSYVFNCKLYHFNLHKKIKIHNFDELHELYSTAYFLYSYIIIPFFFCYIPI